MILALNGGGIRGALQVGALLELPGVLLDTFKDGVYGVSVGAIIATYVAFGFSATDLSEIFTEWSDVPLHPPSIDAFTKMYTSQGLDDGSIIRDRMVKNFLKKGLDFEKLRIRDAHIPLHIVATDLTNVRVVADGVYAARAGRYDVCGRRRYVHRHFKVHTRPRPQEYVLSTDDSVNSPAAGTLPRRRYVVCVDERRPRYKVAVSEPYVSNRGRRYTDT